MKLKYQSSTKVKRAQLQALRREFKILGMKEGEKVDEYFARTLTIVNKMKAQGKRMEQSVIIEKILRSMTLKFNYVVCLIEESNDLSTMTIYELQSSLLVHEQRMQGQKEEEHALKITNSEKVGGRNEYRVEGRGRARGSFRGGGRGRGRSAEEVKHDVLEWGDENEVDNEDVDANEVGEGLEDEQADQETDNSSSNESSEEAPSSPNQGRNRRKTGLVTTADGRRQLLATESGWRSWLDALFWLGSGRPRSRLKADGSRPRSRLDALFCWTLL
ncbi:hypothetical protein LWI28_005230 [Acer negundo]|uniref:Retrovirus-related Pol polyprotein from transposon TNT 1-94 n=1 Tax=Acer negundo TaxID=4023 RepID=A0AAD5J3B9_ACENE|nr:hypothetical protein LWI28_005230 [Acer negundo]